MKQTRTRQVRITRGRHVAGRVLGTVLLAAAIATGGLTSAVAAPETAPAPVRERLAAAEARSAPGATHARTGERQTLRLNGSDAEDTNDDAPYLYVDPACAVGSGKAKPNAAVATTTKLKLDYVLTGTSLRKTGTLTAKAYRENSLKLKAVRVGTYRLTLSLHGRTALVADQTFSVVPCVTVTASCHAVTFTNPGGAAANVIYKAHKKGQFFDVDVAAGQARTVRADYTKIDWNAASLGGDGPSDLGRGTIKVKQECAHAPATPADNAVQSEALVGCSADGALAHATLGWSAQPSLTGRRWEVVGTDSSGTFTDAKTADLALAPGSYVYRTYANGLATPFEEIDFRVLACVQVTARCRAVQVDNPNDVAVTVMLTPPDDEEGDFRARTASDPGDEPEDDPSDGAPFTLAAQTSRTVPWTETSVFVLALGGAEADFFADPFLELASSWLPADGEPEPVAVDQSC